MIRTKLLVPAALAVAALAAVAGSLAFAAPAKDSKDATPAAPACELPPGWSTEDMHACMAAGIPGKQHEQLARLVGEWRGRTQMWMAPDTEPVSGECTWTVTSIMDGRYVRAEMTGELPGMGAFQGLGYTGFDNVAQKFVGNWLDNHSTGIMNGVGELSADGRVMSWRYTYSCPIRKKQAVVRQVETYTSADTMAFEMFTTCPKTGRESKCMHIDFTRKP